MEKPLLLAEAPGRAGTPDGPLTGRAGDRLARFAGFDGWLDVHERFEVRNLLDEFPGPRPNAEKGTRWPVAQAREAAERFPLGGVCVLLGRRVAAAYEIESAWGVWTYAPGRLVVVLPHPSGVNVLYNDPGMRGLARDVLADALRLAARAAA